MSGFGLPFWTTIPILETARKLQISWGVYSIHAKQDAQNATEMVSIACKALKNKRLAEAGNSIVITAGVPFGSAGSTNLLRIAEIIDDKDLT